MDQDTNTSHSQAVDIGQALLTAGLMSAVSGHQQFSDGSELYLPTYNPDTAEADLKDEPDSSPQGHSDIIEPAWLRDLPNISVIDDSEEPKERPVKRDSTKDRKGSDQGDSGLLEELRHSVRKGRQAEESLDQSGLDEVYRRHEAEYLLSLLRVESIPTEWTQTICQLADVAVTTVKPDVRYSNDEMDILAYVKVKCVSGGRREESRMVEGEVCSLQLTHKDMATAIPQPRIALVEESIMFKDRNTMVSLETVTLQEAEYVKNAIAKLLDLKPSLAVTKTAARVRLPWVTPAWCRKLRARHTSISPRHSARSAPAPALASGSTHSVSRAAPPPPVRHAANLRMLGWRYCLSLSASFSRLQPGL